MYAGIQNRASAEETLPAKNTGCNRDHKRHILSYKCNYAGGMGKKKKKTTLLFFTASFNCFSDIFPLLFCASIMRRKIIKFNYSCS